MPQYKLLIQRYPYGGVEASECVSWLMQTYAKAARDPRFSEVRSAWVNDTPITMTRNQSFIAARKAGFDFMLLVDSDMAPDHELLTGDRAAVPFFDAAVEHALKSPKPCVIAAPYCGPPPHENVYVFRWANRGNTLHPAAANARLDQYTREEAAGLAGVQEVAALPTGLMLMDLRVLDGLPHPYTYYEYARGGADECPGCHQKARGPEDEKASTEDVTFTRDLGMLGVPILCAWSSWAGHIKRYVVGKPRMYTTDFVAHKMRAAIASRTFAGDQLVEVEMDPELAAIMATRGNDKFRGAEAAPPPVTVNEAEFLRPERGTVPAGGGGVGVPVELADHTLKLSPDFADLIQQPYLPPPGGGAAVRAADRKWDPGLEQAMAVVYYGAQKQREAAERNPAHPLNLDPGFASLVNQTYTPTPGLRDNFVGPTEGGVDGAAPPPAGGVYPWQMPATEADLLARPPG